MTKNRPLSFMFHAPTKIVFRENAVQEAKQTAQSMGISKALLVTDEGLFNTEVVQKVRVSLGDLCAAVYGKVVGDTGIHFIEEAASLAKEAGVDGVVSVGGGSSMDTAKSVSILLKYGGRIQDYMGLPVFKKPLAPHLAIPTTAGTGSEVTASAVIKDWEKQEKVIVTDQHLIPQVAILDPCLTVNLPPKLTAGTGMDALCHAIEALHSRMAEPFTDALAFQAIKLIFQYLPRCFENGKDVEARGFQLIASTCAGHAIQNALVGVVHAMSHAVGAKCGVHHGTLNAIFLPHGMRFNLEKCEEKYARITHVLGQTDNLDTRSAAEKSIALVEELVKKIGLPTKLSEVNVPETALPEITNHALGDGSHITNMRRVKSPDEIMEMMKKAF